MKLIDQRSRKIKIGPQQFITFFIPNEVCKFRAETFFCKEPETLEWIDNFSKKNSNLILIDIGANIGTYSLYNSVKFKNKSILFEPSPLNVKWIFKNINLNKISKLCHVSTIPLSNENSSNFFNLSNFDEGGALSSFGVDYGFDGNFFKSKAKMNIAGITLDRYLELFYQIEEDKKFIVKLDVDGIEHLILCGSSKTLKNKNCLSVLVEVNEDFKEQQNDIESLLAEYGFVLKAKKQSLMSQNSNLFSTSYNYIYLKKRTISKNFF